MDGFVTAHAGAVAFVSRAFRSMNLPGVCDANLSEIRKIKKGYSPGQMVESLSLACLVGCERVADIDGLSADEAVAKMLGYKVPGSRTARDFLDAFHDEDRVLQAQKSAVDRKQTAYIPDATPLQEGLLRILGTSARASAAKSQGSGVSMGTIDMDATIIESRKRCAKFTYEGTRGFQPMVAMWMEADAVVATEFRDGNVPARMHPKTCAVQAFKQLPKDIHRFAFRGDSANYDWELLRWLRDEQRPDGPKGRIEFAISAMMSPELTGACTQVRPSEWITFGTEDDGTIRQCAEVLYTPTEPCEKACTQALRYIGLRLLKPKGLTFADGADRRLLALVTNSTLPDAAKVIQWHRQKAGTIEHVHDELKNALAGAALPSQRFGANAAWFTINAIAYNLASAMRAVLPDTELRTARLKALRFHLFQVAARVVRDSRKISVRFAASKTWMVNMRTFCKQFPCRTQATG
jgi:hypothetical protein